MGYRTPLSEQRIPSEFPPQLTAEEVIHAANPEALVVVVSATPYRVSYYHDGKLSFWPDFIHHTFHPCPLELPQVFGTLPRLS